MCRQFMRKCRDCLELFPMTEADMREHCKAFQKAQITKPDLIECPEEEIQVLRPLSGHGGKLCGFCRTKNRSVQRERENAQKRARRAKLKREKMTAGIGAGNVVWTPKLWTPSALSTQTLALHTPQSCRDTFKVRSTTQAIQYGLSGGIGRTTMAQNHLNISQNQRGVCTQSSQELTASMAAPLLSREKYFDTVGADIYDAISPSHQYGNDPQDYSPITTTTLPTPSYEGPKHEEIGLGITLPNAAKWTHSDTETCSFNEWSFRTELNHWSTLSNYYNEFDCGGVKEYEEGWKLSEYAGALLDARSLQPSTVFAIEEEY